MLKILSFTILMCSILISQEEITVYVDSKVSQVTLFEKELIQRVIELKEKRENTKIKVTFVEMESFNDGFKYMEQNSFNNLMNKSLVINEISYTKERAEKYTFSNPYMYNKFTVMTFKHLLSDTQEKEFNSNAIYGVVEGSIFHDKLLGLNKKREIKFKVYPNAADIYTGLIEKEIDFIYSDYIDCWGFKLEPVFFTDDMIDQFCFLFPKNSMLAENLNTYLTYYIKSQQFYQLIKSYFGREAVLFFKKSMTSK